MFFKKPTPNAKIVYIIAGLGNPGRQYENTRHNAGFICMDYLCDQLSVKLNKIRFKSSTGVAEIGSKGCLLIKPSTFMNLSGQAVCEAMRFYKIPPERTIIMFDDISLDVGKMRVRRKGSDGGHNGMKNIIYLSGSQDFPRIKIGIGKKPHPDYDLKDWVLSRFTEQDKQAISKILPNVKDAIQLIVENNIDEAMNRYN